MRKSTSTRSRAMLRHTRDNSHWRLTNNWTVHRSSLNGFAPPRQPRVFGGGERSPPTRSPPVANDRRGRPFPYLVSLRLTRASERDRSALPISRDARFDSRAPPEIAEPLPCLRHVQFTRRPAQTDRTVPCLHSELSRTNFSTKKKTTNMSFSISCVDWAIRKF